MAEPLLTKRLHISGITPSMTPADLERRLSSFGRVNAMDGFGARDALGDPRKFGFVTMEISAKELARCLNILSGSTWKGAKLRIGEARPDFRERLAQIDSLPPRPVRPKRTHARNHGYPSSTLPLTPLSATAAASTPGWITTPSGRVVRPMRMRPERPLEPMHNEASGSVAKVMNSKRKKRVKPLPVRARRRLIDPTKWDSAYLKGVFLDSIPMSSPTLKGTLAPSGPLRHDAVDDEEMDDDDIDSDTRSTLHSALPWVQETAVATSRTHDTIGSTDVRDEANAALAMLGKIFGDKENWDERESIDGIEVSEYNKMGGKVTQVGGEVDIEIVPRDFKGEESKSAKKYRGKGQDKETSQGIIYFGHESEMGAEAMLAKDVEMEQNNHPEVLVRTTGSAPRTSLKDLFAPKEDTSFSFFDHLNPDLDLEFDADVLGINASLDTPLENGHSSQPTLSLSRVVEIPAAKSRMKARSRVMLNPSLPSLFPSPDSLPHPYALPTNSIDTSHQHGTSCFLFPSASLVRGLYHLPPRCTFARSPQDTSVTIREMWEKDKSSLTHEWKKAWREARWSRKGRAATGGDAC